MDPTARPITAAETIPIRWEILRPGFPRETAIFPGDEAPETRHFGVFLEDRLVGVASLYRAVCPDEPAAVHPLQLRGMATLPEVRGLGAGRVLLQACERTARQEGCDWLWCNARLVAVPFYEKHGWVVRTGEFEIPTVGPHVRMTRTL